MAAHQSVIVKRTKAEKRVEKCELARRVGRRFREARELCNMSQIDAAARLGYANSSKLAKIENGSDTETVAFDTIYRAAMLYDVSIDFLYGVSEDWERDPVVSAQREIGWFIRAETERMVAREIHVRSKLATRLAVVEKSMSRILKTLPNLRDAVDRFRELNKGFDDMLGGAKLLKMAIEVAEEAAGISSELKRYQALHDVADKVSEQPKSLDLFKDGF